METCPADKCWFQGPLSNFYWNLWCFEDFLLPGRTNICSPNGLVKLHPVTKKVIFDVPGNVILLECSVHTTQDFFSLYKSKKIPFPANSQGDLRPFFLGINCPKLMVALPAGKLFPAPSMLKLSGNGSADVDNVPG